MADVKAPLFTADGKTAGEIELDAEIFGISRDSLESHAKFREKEGLTFDLLSDVDGDVTERYGVWKEKKMYGKNAMGIERTTFVIGPDGRIAKVFPKVKVEAAVKTEILDRVIEAIEKSANTGKIGDGKIFVFDLEQVVRIRTGETGADAL